MSTSISANLGDLLVSFPAIQHSDSQWWGVMARTAHLARENILLNLCDPLSENLTCLYFPQTSFYDTFVF